MDVKKALIYTAVMCLALFVLFRNFDDRLLWGDEAETALLAVNITKYKVPKVTDGKNVITLIGKGHDYNDDNIWVWSPWLDEYITAGSFAVLGKSTFSARLPFVLIAFLSVLFLARVTHSIYHRHELTLATMLLYLTNVAFLLHARQCRYYALIMFAQIWMIYGYYQLIVGRSKVGVLHLVIPLTIQFYCNYIVVPGNILAMCVSALITYRRHNRLLINLSACFAIVVLLATPWLLYAKPWVQSSYLGFQDVGSKLIYYILNVQFYILPLIVLLIPVIWHCIKRSEVLTHTRPPDAKDTEVLLWVLMPAHLLVLCMTPGAFFRYLTPVIPVLILLSSIVLVYYVRPYVLRYLLFATLCLSNVISVFSAYPIFRTQKVEMPIVRFIHEISSDYQDRLKDVVSFLQQNAMPDESVFVFDPEFPLIFYTGMRVIDSRFGAKLNMKDLPDWILSESASGVISYPPVRLPKALHPFYKSIRITVHDTPRDASRPDPAVHVSFTSRRRTRMTIYKKNARFPETGKVYNDTLTKEVP